ncbi:MULTISPECIES: tyrosine-type recombinase/integrase [Mycolicibacterium]|nr:MULTISPECIES: site-specific integrase [Mycolicibacterium]MCW1820792.1 site-specific integrase [Mycolicibacterium senegalense]
MSRVNRGGGVWDAACRFRDSDGITRRVQKRSPAGQYDRHGKLAVDVLMDALAERRPPSADQITLHTLVVDTVKIHLTRLAEDGKESGTLSSYGRALKWLTKYMGGVRVGEATVPRLDAVLRAIYADHGKTPAHHAKVILKGGLQLAVMAGVLDSNPARDLDPIKPGADDDAQPKVTKATKPKGQARALTDDEFERMRERARASEVCRKHDVVDVLIMLQATGLRISEVMAFRWSDINWDTAEITVTGSLVDKPGHSGGFWRPKTKTTTAKSRARKTDVGRVLALPQFAMEMLKARREVPFYGEQEMLFPHDDGNGKYRRLSQASTDLRRGLDDIGLPDVSSHSFRRTVATKMDRAGMSARAAADQLGHAKPSITLDVYTARGGANRAVADLLDGLAPNDE